MKDYEPCDIRGDEGLRTRKENISTCVTSHIAQNGGMNHAGLVKEYEVCDFRYDEGFRTRVDNTIMPTLATKSGGGMSQLPYAIEREKMEEKANIRIRKLTPRECYRLMGFDDESFDKAKAVNSDTQLYKQAGNSIVVQVLEDIFKEML